MESNLDNRQNWDHEYNEVAFQYCYALGGNDYSAVNKLRRRVHKRMEEDKYAKVERNIKELLSNVEI